MMSFAFVYFYSLQDRAKNLLKLMPTDSITNWKALV